LLGNLQRTLRLSQDPLRRFLVPLAELPHIRRVNLNQCFRQRQHSLRRNLRRNLHRSRVRLRRPLVPMAERLR
jgi:hypothetical protein